LTLPQGEALFYGKNRRANVYTIGEFSRLTGLTVKTLRFYHERGILEPKHIDLETGYRYYDEGKLATAQIIVQLRALEFSLDDISTILAECTDDEDMLRYLERHKQTVAEKLAHYRQIQQALDQIIHQERETREIMKMAEESFEIEEKDLAPVRIAGIRMTGKYSDCGIGFGKLGKAVGRYIGGKAMCLYYDSEYKEDDADIEPCFPIQKDVSAEGIDVRELPGARCVTLVHHGPYDTLGRSYARVLDYTKEKGYEIVRPTREVYLKGPGMILKGNPKKYLTEIQFPIVT
jgi:effector-binding domain-containing protein/DNA-binding transcriptional MerR regulator